MRNRHKNQKRTSIGTSATELLFAMCMLLTPAVLSGAFAAPNDSMSTVCVGYNKELRYWGLMGVSPARPEDHCAANEAVVFHTPVVGANVGAGMAPIEGTCCPIIDGALSLHHSYSVEECPPDSVVTGARFVRSSGDSIGHYELRCTQINTDRFVLSDFTEVLRFEYGIPGGIQPFGHESLRWTSRGRLPKHLRYGIGRLSRTSWLQSGCLGYPWGAVMTRQGYHGCERFGFRKLLERTPSSLPTSSSQATFPEPARVPVVPQSDTPHLGQ